MKDLVKSPIDFRKKISLNINIAILNLVKDLSRLTRTNNTLVIESLLVNGIPSLLKQFKTSWTSMFCDTKDKKKKEHLNKLLEDLNKIYEREEYRPFFLG